MLLYLATLFTDGFITDLTAEVNRRLAAKREQLKELRRAGRPTDRDVAPAPVWGSIHPGPTDEPATAGGPPEAVVALTSDRREAARRLSKSQPRS